MDGEAWKAAVHGVAKSWTQLSNFSFTFHFHALQKEMATQSSVLAWRIPGPGEPGGLPSTGSRRVGHMTVWITINCVKFWKRWECQTTWPASWEICMQVRKQQLELDLEQQTGSKSGKEYVKAVYYHPAYLTYMQNTSWETLDWKKAGIRIAGRNINNLRYADDTTLMKRN